jgi:prepilin-type N-terminal cleavage/methylation domain-containing protein
MLFNTMMPGEYSCGGKAWVISPGARPGFTIVELLVVISIIALLVAMLLPALSRVRASANSVQCMSNLRQIGHWGQVFINDHKGILPHQAWGPPTQRRIVSPSWIQGLYPGGYNRLKSKPTRPRCHPLPCIPALLWQE